MEDCISEVVLGHRYSPGQRIFYRCSLQGDPDVNSVKAPMADHFVCPDLRLPSSLHTHTHTHTHKYTTKRTNFNKIIHKFSAISPLLTKICSHNGRRLVCDGHWFLFSLQESGLSDWLGNQLSVLQTIPSYGIVIIVCVMITTFTEFTSNVATATIFLPILATLVSHFDEQTYARTLTYTHTHTCTHTIG